MKVSVGRLPVSEVWCVIKTLYVTIFFSYFCRNMLYPRKNVTGVYLTIGRGGGSRATNLCTRIGHFFFDTICCPQNL